MKKALCVGINDYSGTANDLSGCVNDAFDWNGFLVRMGFECVRLLDKEATIANIGKRLREMLSEAGPDDVVVFTYSGHGTRVPDYNGDEADYYDEALYVYDGIFLDDDLNNILSSANDKTSVLVILDSCFSGTATRMVDIAGKKIRFHQVAPTRPSQQKRYAFGDISTVQVLMSGCQDDEYSYDAWFNGRANGAFSFYALRTYKQGMTYDQWHQEIRKYLPSSEFPQSPQLEGFSFYTSGLAFENSDVPLPEEEKENKWVSWVLYGLLAAIVTFLVIQIFW